MFGTDQISNIPVVAVSQGGQIAEIPKGTLINSIGNQRGGGHAKVNRDNSYTFLDMNVLLETDFICE